MALMTRTPNEMMQQVAPSPPRECHLFPGSVNLRYTGSELGSSFPNHNNSKSIVLPSINLSIPIRKPFVLVPMNPTNYVSHKEILPFVCSEPTANQSSSRHEKSKLRHTNNLICHQNNRCLLRMQMLGSNFIHYKNKVYFIQISNYHTQKEEAFTFQTIIALSAE